MARFDSYLPTLYDEEDTIRPLNKRWNLNKKKNKIAVGGTLAFSLISNVILISVLTANRTSSQAKPDSASIPPISTNTTSILTNTTSIPPIPPVPTSSQALPNSTCPGNGTRFDLGENLWAHICYSESIPAWILDIRFFFGGKPSIKGVPLTKKQWLVLDKNREILVNKWL